MNLKSLARDERADLAAFLATLSPAEWEGPTLCAGWRVHDVVAHMVSYEEEVTGPGEALLMAMAGRRGVVGELSGPGQPTLAGRVGT